MSEPEQKHYRYRIRFAKKGLMRFVGHQELMRVFERALRRCGFRIRPREGFRTKVRLSFPLSLALGFEAEEEVFQVDLQQHVPENVLASSLQAELPEGLRVLAVREVEPYRRSRVIETRYRLTVPSDRLETVAEKIQRWTAGEPARVLSNRKGVEREVDLRPALQWLKLTGDALEFAIAVNEHGSARPADVLKWLGLDDLLTEGLIVTRTRVILEDETDRTDQPGSSL